MTTLYKLTDQNGQTKNNTQWGEGITHTARDLGDGETRNLCTDTVIHAYTDPYLAIVMNPIHTDITDPKLWIAQGEIVVQDATKVGCISLLTESEISIPYLTTNQIIRFGIYCALEVCKDPAFDTWAEAWLSKQDRSARAADAAAANAAARAAYAAAHAAYAYAAADAADAAAYAARAAYAAAHAAYAYAAARAAARAAYAAYAARAAADAAYAAESIDLVALLKKAIKDEGEETST